MTMAAPKPANPRTIPATQATTAQIRKDGARRSGTLPLSRPDVREWQHPASCSIAGAWAEHHIMQAMPSKNLAVSTVPLHMPYVQRRPELADVPAMLQLAGCCPSLTSGRD